MSIFGSIVSAIFGTAKAGSGVTDTMSAAAASITSGSASAAPAAPTAKAAGSGVTDTMSAVAASVTSGSAPAAPKPMTREEVEAMIQKIAASTGRETYKWKQSIVDLMKLLNIDSSLNARKELAQELGYTGALNGSAEMNIWLHKQVMTKLMEGGGVVPASLK
ncbi:MAG: DUF3597 family protein [Rhizobiales bacterium]|nr:DUF3597 family protein [Hyphomicrobiales bacterium]